MSNENDTEPAEFVQDNVVLGKFPNQTARRHGDTDRVLTSAIGQLDSVVILGVRRESKKLYIGTRLDRRSEFFDLIARAFAWATRRIND